jgi:hypothetical protein
MAACSDGCPRCTPSLAEALTSVGNSTKKDAVKFIGKRA